MVVCYIARENQYTKLWFGKPGHQKQNTWILTMYTIINDFYTLTHLTFITTLFGKYSYFLHFIQRLNNLTKVIKLINSRAETKIWQSGFRTCSFNYYTVVFSILIICPRPTNIFSHLPKLIFPNPPWGQILLCHTLLLKLLHNFP